MPGHESKALRRFRFSIYTLAATIYLGYLGYLLYNVVTDKPFLTTEYSLVKKIYVPDIEICAPVADLSILRCDFSPKQGNVTRIDNCTGYLLDDNIDLGQHRGFCYTFKASKTLQFVHPDNPEDGLRKIGFYFQIKNLTAAEEKNLGIASLSIQLTSPDFNPLLHPELAVDPMDQAARSDLQLQWNFIAGMSGYVALVKFKTSVYKAILPSDIGAVIGFGPNYHTTPMIDSQITYFPFNKNPFEPPNGTTGYFSVAAGSFIQEETTERRSNTILSGIALAGGAFGIIGGALALLFGQRPARPWGYVHKFTPMPPEKIPDAFLLDYERPTLSETEQKQLFDAEGSSLSQADRAKRLELEIYEMKNMIKHYLLDTSYLEKLTKKNRDK